MSGLNVRHMTRIPNKGPLSLRGKLNIQRHALDQQLNHVFLTLTCLLLQYQTNEEQVSATQCLLRINRTRPFFFFFFTPININSALIPGIFAKIFIFACSMIKSTKFTFHKQNKTPWHSYQYFSLYTDKIGTKDFFVDCISEHKPENWHAYFCIFLFTQDNVKQLVRLDTGSSTSTMKWWSESHSMDTFCFQHSISFPINCCLKHS